MRKNLTFYFGKIWQKIRDLRGLISAFFLVMAFLFMGVALWRSWMQIAPFFRQIEIHYLFLAEGCIALASFFGVVNWYFVQRGFGIGLSGMESARSHIASNVIRYIPGYAWQYLGKAYLSGVNQDNRKIVSIALLTEFVVLILSGISLLGFIVIFSPIFFAATWLPGTIWWVISLISSLGIFFWLFLCFRLTNIIITSYTEIIFSILGALLCSLIGWITLSLATWYVVNAFSPALSNHYFSQVFFALVASTIFGILVIFVPGGLGVRESALAFLLNGILPLSMGIVVSIFLRIGIIIAELIGFAFIFQGLRPFLNVKKQK